MPKPHSYTQCTMKSEDWHIHTAWIPKQFASINKRIKIDKLQPDTVWTVIECGETKPAEFVEQHARDYKHAYASIEER